MNNCRAAIALVGCISGLIACSRPEPANHPQPTQLVTSSTTAAAPAAQANNAATATAGSTALRVDSPARTSLVSEGSPAPHFRAVAHNGNVIELQGSRERPLVLYFYPRDQTPGCTVEAQGFRDAAEQFRAAGVEVVGVSTDDNTAHQAFATHENLGFALISDPDGRLAASFGVGVRLGFAQRITFVINKMGNVVKVFSSVTPAGHAAEVLAVARQS